jgi:hypothetical protein
VEGGRARFALPDPAHRDHCLGAQPDVEAALASHFGRPVPLELTVDGAASAAAPSASSSAADDIDEGASFEDIAELTDAPTTPHATPTDRIKNAFPGAEEVS